MRSGTWTALALVALGSCTGREDAPPASTAASAASPGVIATSQRGASNPRGTNAAARFSSAASASADHPASHPRRTPPASIPAGIGCASAGCHDDFAKTDYVHAPVASGACSICHSAEQPGHRFPLTRPANQTCTFCHAVFSGKPHRHQPVVSGECIVCHDPHAASHKFLFREPIADRCRTCHPLPRRGHDHLPFAAGGCSACHAAHEADDAHLTIQTGAEHCFRCHAAMKDRLAAASTRHPPVDSSCATCHDPHTADQPGLLKVAATDQCLACHADVAAAVRGASEQHGALITKKGCGNCHDPHGSGEPKLLTAPLDRLCLGCHDQPQKAPDGRTIRSVKAEIADSPFLHGPVRHGQCQVCHQVHGSSNTRLLARHFSPEFYGKFDVTNYALCFSCHPSAAVTERDDARVTGFRNGTRNLHFVHVNQPEKGRSCKACHEIHGSRRPMHIAAEVAFDRGGWSMPIQFTKTDTGGSCAPGCHQAYSYDREKPVSYPTTQEAAP
jgi:predicted CXXCH cytochrome family protein